MKTTKNIFIALISIFILAGCTQKEKHDLIILYPNWAEGIAMTHLADVILNEKGYSASLKRIEPGPMYAALSKGDADVYMDAWLPHTHKDYWERFGDKLEIIGSVFDNGITGLVVPSYVEINSIEELNANKDKFGGQIYGIAAGAGIHSNTEKAIKEYNLDYTQISSSETSMLTALRKAESQKEWIVITGWKPHFMWFKHDLKALEDPLSIYPTDRISIISRLGFKEEKPELAEFFKNFVLSEDLLGELINDVESQKEAKDGARIFYDKHKEMLDTWLKSK